MGWVSRAAISVSRKNRPGPSVAARSGHRRGGSRHFGGRAVLQLQGNGATVDDGPLRWEGSGRCAFATDVDYSSDAA